MPPELGGTMSVYGKVLAARSEGTSAEQFAVVVAIRRARNLHPAYGPSIAELAAAIGSTKTDVYQKLMRLRRDGLVAWEDRIARSIRLTEEQYE
jgi:DNA-binding MarR family transcriptional regulator